jgi:hypothetical protein
VFETRPGTNTLKYSAKGGKPRPEPIATPGKAGEIPADSSDPWRDVVPGIGAKGQIAARDKMAGKDAWSRVGKLRDGLENHAPRDAPADATPEEIRTPAPPRRAGGQYFRQREK